MQLLALIAPLLSLVAFVAYVWLVVVAFKKSTLWGLLVLFLSPITAIIFGIKNWEESKKPFLIYVGSVAGSVAIFVLSFAAMGGFAMMQMATQMDELTEEDANAFIEAQFERMENSGALDAQEQRELGQMKQMFQEIRTEGTGSEIQPTATPEPYAAAVEDAAPARPVPPKALLASVGRQRDDGATPDLHAPDPLELGRPLSFRDARRLVGSNVRIVSTDGRELKGRIAEAGRDELTLEWWLNSGTISFDLKASDIQSLELLR